MLVGASTSDMLLRDKLGSSALGALTMTRLAWPSPNIVLVSRLNKHHGHTRVRTKLDQGTNVHLGWLVHGYARRRTAVAHGRAEAAAGDSCRLVVSSKYLSL